MTKAELLAQARLDLDDGSTPYLWSDAELTVYLQEAEREAAERADLLEVEGVATYCTVSLVAGTATYPLSTLVYDIKKARITGESEYLERTSRDALDAENPAWEDDSGTPKKYYLNGTNLRLWPNPSANGTLTAVVYRLPIATMGTSPEIHARYHRRMLDWVYRLAYLKRDEDTQNLAEAARYEKMFEDSFGPRWDATQEKRRLKRTPTIMKDTES